MSAKNDPADLIRERAGQYTGVAQGKACTQSAFKVGNNAFLYIGEQGGRYKAMFKLSASKSEAEELAKSEPEDFQVGNTAWVTARFSAEKPLPEELWRKWLDESYQLCLSKAPSRKTVAAPAGSRKPPRKSK